MGILGLVYFILFVSSLRYWITSLQGHFTLALHPDGMEQHYSGSGGIPWSFEYTHFGGEMWPRS